MVEQSDNIFLNFHNSNCSDFQWTLLCFWWINGNVTYKVFSYLLDIRQQLVIISSLESFSIINLSYLAGFWLRLDQIIVLGWTFLYEQLSLAKIFSCHSSSTDSNVGRFLRLSDSNHKSLLGCQATAIQSGCVVWNK